MVRAASRRIPRRQSGADGEEHARRALESLTEQLELVRGDADEVRAAGADFVASLPGVDPSRRRELLDALADRLTAHDGALHEPAFAVLTAGACTLEDDAPLWRRMLSAPQGELRPLVARHVLPGIERSPEGARHPLLPALARSVLDDEDALDEGLRRRLERVLGRTTGRRSAGAVAAALGETLRGPHDHQVRRLASRLLDIRGVRPRPDDMAALLGGAAADLLAPYLTYTRAGFEALLDLGGGRPLPDSLVERFARAEAVCGARLMRDIVARLGWSRVSLGLEARRLTRLEPAGGLPWLVTGDEAALLAGLPGVAQGEGCLLVTAQGAATASGAAASPAHSDPVDRFRALNLVHAELLSEILDLTPLDRAKIDRILEGMDRVVEGYCHVFGGSEAECRLLPRVYAGLKNKVTGELAEMAPDQPPGANLVHLMQSFEDPRSLGEVRTVHGLKRYLHQKGLKLGLRLVGADCAADRTVDLLLARDGAVVHHVEALQYAVFEAPVQADPEPWLPHPVDLAVAGLARQLLYGQTEFPREDLYLFGNEVQAYFYFRNHPVFVRLDFSPPQRGGMLDLEYYGVSAYEEVGHPDPALPAVRALLRAEGFDVKRRGTRLFVRFDKESCRDLADLDERAAALFRVAPYLMDADWLVGGLDLDADGRACAMRAWAERLHRSGVLPTKEILDGDRRRVRCGAEPGPGGARDVHWDGSGPYRDRCADPPPAGLLKELSRRLVELGLPAPSFGPDDEKCELGLLNLDREALAPLRQALRLGLVVREGAGLRRADPSLAQPVHAADFLAELLRRPGPVVRQVAALAEPLGLLERLGPGRPCGAIGQALLRGRSVPVRGGVVQAWTLLDGEGAACGGFATLDSQPVRRRATGRGRWRLREGLTAERLLALLGGANYLTAAGTAPPAAADPGRLWSLARLPAPAADACADDAQRLVDGDAAAPGRTVGRAVFGAAGRRAALLDGAVLVLREVRPDDARDLVRAAGLVSTGGALLSHAALMAMQLGRPALVVRADWSDAPRHDPVLVFTCVQWRESRSRAGGMEIVRREEASRRRDELREGDLVVLDADRGRLQVLGQDRDALALYEGMRQLRLAQSLTAAAEHPAAVLEARALRLRAGHQLGKTVAGLRSPVLAGFAVEELVRDAAAAGADAAEQERLLLRALDNHATSDAARRRLCAVTEQMRLQAAAACAAAVQADPVTAPLHEMITLRLRAHRLSGAWRAAAAVVRKCGLAAAGEGGSETGGPPAGGPDCDLDEVDRVAAALVDRRSAALSGRMRDLLAETRPAPEARHVLRRAERLVEAGAASVALRGLMAELADRIVADEARARRARGRPFILDMSAAGPEAANLVGWKAANLADTVRLLDETCVPPWFAVTDAALARLLDAAPDDRGAPRLRERVAEALQSGAEPSRVAARVAALFERTAPPPDLERAVRDAYAELGRRAGEDRPWVAVRSSTCEEDTEDTVGAGVFATFLYVRGATDVLRHLKRAWAALWGERALAARAAAHRGAAPEPWPTGGLVVQVMVPARVSGVLQTVDVAGGDPGRMRLSVGLGLGEGVVGGTVPADIVTVEKRSLRRDPAAPLRFHYVTADKTTCVARDPRSGGGTRVVETLYHQRMRPALEYHELRGLVDRALRLEAIRGEALDIEFTLADHRLWLLQVRPVGRLAGELRDPTHRLPPLPAAGGGRRPPTKSRHKEKPS